MNNSEDEKEGEDLICPTAYEDADVPEPLGIEVGEEIQQKDGLV